MMTKTKFGDLLQDKHFLVGPRGAYRLPLHLYQPRPSALVDKDESEDDMLPLGPTKKLV